jgi:hypothetical protein
VSLLVLQRDGFKFLIYSREGNEPPHVHVRRGGAVAKFWLDSAGVADSRGFRSVALTRIGLIVTEEREFFLRRWYEHFAQFPPQEARKGKRKE